MAEPIGALRAQLSASAAAFTKDMGRARKAVSAEAGRMQRSFALMRESGAALSRQIFNIRNATIAAAGAGAMGMLVKRAVDGADSIAKTARAIGVTGEELQELRFAAERSGIAQERLDKSMEAFTRRLGQAKQGTGQAKRALDELGVSMAEIEGKSPAEALSLVADRLRSVEDPMRRNAILADLFSRQGIIMGNMLAQGSAEMEALRARARELGLVLDEDLLRGAELAADQMSDMQKVISVGLQRSMLSFMPVMQEFSRIVTDPAFVAALDNFGKGMAEGMQAAMPHVRAVLAGIASAYDTFSSLPAWLQTSGILGAILFGKLRAIMVGAVLVNEAIKKVSGGIDILKEAGRLAGDAMARFGVTSGEATAVDTDLMREAISEARQMALATGQVGDAAAGTAPSVQQLDKDVKGLADTLGEGPDVAQSFAGAISEFAGNAVTDFERTGEAVDNLKRRLLDLIVQMAVVDPLQRALTGMLGGGTGWAATVTPALPGFARGGSFKMGGAGGHDSQVAAMRLTPGEMVHVTKGECAGGGTVINQHNEFQTGMTGPDMARIRAMIERSKREAVAESQRETTRRLRSRSDALQG